MSVGKQDSAPGQACNMWRLRAAITAQTFNPVVEIINSDKQNVGLIRRQCRAAAKDPRGNQSAEHYFFLRF